MMNTLPPQKEMHQAFLNSDASYNGIFYTAVTTTGIFCLPSCTARKPRSENVEFFSNVREALFAGYRPCKRCRPMHVNNVTPPWIQTLLDEIENNPSISLNDYDLRARGIDPARVRRYFHKYYGMTFHAYRRGRRLSRSFEKIRNGDGLDDVIFDSGYSSHSGFRSAFAKIFGKSPGKSETVSRIETTWIETPLGPMLTGATKKGVCLLEFTDRRMLETQLKTIQKRFSACFVPGNHAHFTLLKKQLSEYFKKMRQEFTVPLDYPGSEFQQKVWDALQTIPYGQTCSYEDIARKIGNPRAVRAVGRTNGENRIAILIPCHRVVNKDGQLGGYGGGLWRKKFLLDLEQTT